MVGKHAVVFANVKKSKGSKNIETDESYSEEEEDGGEEDDELNEEEYSEQEDAGKSAADYSFWAPEAYYNTVIDEAIKKHRRKSGSRDNRGKSRTQSRSRENSGSRGKSRTQKQQETRNVNFNRGIIPHFLSQKAKTYRYQSPENVKLQMISRGRFPLKRRGMILQAQRRLLSPRFRSIARKGRTVKKRTPLEVKDRGLAMSLRTVRRAQ
jgi:hypothetical protein